MKLMLDFYSGLGGASEAFVQGSEPWAVLRYENNPLLADVPYTTLCDLTNFDIHIRHRVDLIWASPPCLDFSMAYNAPGPKAKREGREFVPDMSLVHRAAELIQELKPTYWVLENVIGSIKYLKPLFGEPRQIIGPFVMWGNFPYLDFPVDYKFESKTLDFPDGPMRANERAKIPLELSQALRRAVETQTNIEEWQSLD